MTSPMPVLAVDPGPTHSAWVVFDGQAVTAYGYEENGCLLARFKEDGFDTAVSAVVFEQIESFGMPVGKETFETVFWTGRLFEAATRDVDLVQRLTRKAVKLHLCHTVRAYDGAIRVALKDRFGGVTAAVGTKKAPGPLYGLRAHEWSALAVAVTWWDKRG